MAPGRAVGQVGRISLEGQRGPRHIAAIVLWSADGVMQFWGYLRNEIW
jgi:hypothetical protein